MTRAVSEATDHFLFDPALSAFVRLVTCQMMPAPAIQGDRAGGLRQEGADAAWRAPKLRSPARPRRLRVQSRA